MAFPKAVPERGPLHTRARALRRAVQPSRVVTKPRRGLVRRRTAWSRSCNGPRSGTAFANHIMIFRGALHDRDHAVPTTREPPGHRDEGAWIGRGSDNVVRAIKGCT